MLDSGERESVRSKGLAAKRERGQSLVEMAIIVPLLLFMFLGLIEVGWAIRGYLVLLTTNRETTRFAARGEYLNFQGRDLPEAEVSNRVGYNIVLTHTTNVLESNQLGRWLLDDAGNPLLQPLDQASQGSFIISHYLIDTGAPCKLSDSPGNPNYKCVAACQAKSYYRFDDEILHPGLEGYAHFVYTRPISPEVKYQSRINPFDKAGELIVENNALNCAILQRRSPAFPNPELSVNSVIIVEAFYDQPQLLGVPFLSNTFTDPILLYTQTTMRVTSDKLPQGGACEVLPLALHKNALYNDPPANTQLKSVGTPIEEKILEGAVTGNFGWLRWRLGSSVDPSITQNTNSEVYLSEAINNPRLSLYDYIDPTESSDTILNAEDWVRGKTGVVTSQAVRKAMEARINRVVTFPVWDDLTSAMYHIIGFARVRITNIDFPAAPPKTISGIFMGWDKDC